MRDRRRVAVELLGVDVDAHQIVAAARSRHRHTCRSRSGRTRCRRRSRDRPRRSAPRTAFRLGLAGTTSGWRVQQAARIGGGARPARRALRQARCSGASAASRRRRPGSAGARACAIRSAPRAISAARSGSARRRRRSSGAKRRRPACVITSSGISIWTGPGPRRSRTARRRGRAPRGSSAASVDRDARTAPPSPSCRAGRAVRADGRGPCPACRVALTPEITSIGTESARACAHRGDRVGEPRPGDDEGDAGLAGRARIAVGHEARALLVARRDVADLRAGQARDRARPCGRRECRTPCRRHALRAER